jgi:hypothetical protein
MIILPLYSSGHFSDLVLFVMDRGRYTDSEVFSGGGSVTVAFGES